MSYTWFQSNKNLIYPLWQTTVILHSLHYSLHYSVPPGPFYFLFFLKSFIHFNAYCYTFKTLSILFVHSFLFRLSFSFNSLICFQVHVISFIHVLFFVSCKIVGTVMFYVLFDSLILLIRQQHLINLIYITVILSTLHNCWIRYFMYLIEIFYKFRHAFRNSLVFINSM